MISIESFGDGAGTMEPWLCATSTTMPLIIRLIVSRIFNPSRVQRLAPARLEIAFDHRLPRLAHRLIRTQSWLIQQRLQAHDAPSCRRRADRSSAAQSKPFRHKPAHPTTTPENAQPECANARFCPVSSTCEPRCTSHLRLVEGRRKLQIGRRVVNRIGIQNHQPIHFARIEIGNKRFEIGIALAPCK